MDSIALNNNMKITRRTARGYVRVAEWEQIASLLAQLCDTSALYVDI